MIAYKTILIALSFGIFSVVCVEEEILAQTRSANPLFVEINQSDPLIPAGYGKRSLTSFEQYRLQKEISRLDQTAVEQLKQNNQDEAFKQWYRYLKLSRVLSHELEIKHLGKVGAIAWQSNRGLEVRNIAERLVALQVELSPEESVPVSLLESFAKAYQQVRYIDKAIAIYQQSLDNSITTNDLIAKQKYLETLGRLYLSRFDYANGADIYQELLTLAEKKPQQEKQIAFYLNTLIKIYDRTGATSKAILFRRRLIKQYAKSQNLAKIPVLEIAIANDYKTLEQEPQAIKAYQRTVAVASMTEQLAIASDALISLGKIYQTNMVLEQAVKTYRKLLQIQQKSYNYYGLMDTYDTLGKIHIASNQKTKAKQNFQAALMLAKSLDYKVKYFSQRIRQLDN